MKNVISPLSQGLKPLNLAGWWLRMREPHQQSHMTHRPRGHVTNQKRYISTFTRPWPPKLSIVLAQIRGPIPKNHVTLRSFSQATTQKCHISSTTRPMAFKLSRMVTLVEESSRIKPNDTCSSILWSRYIIYVTLPPLDKLKMLFLILFGTK